MAPDATSTGDDVIEAISSGAAARAMPSPMLLVQAADINQRKSRPSRRGAMSSPSAVTRLILGVGRDA